MRKLNIAFLTELGWPTAYISEALDEVRDENALGASYVRRIHRAVKGGDETILIDRQSGAIHERPISGDPENIKKVKERITNNSHFNTRLDRSD